MFKSFRLLTLVAMLLLSNAVFADTPYKLVINNKTNISFEGDHYFLDHNDSIKIPASQITSVNLPSSWFAFHHVHSNRKGEVWFDFASRSDSYCEVNYPRFSRRTSKYSCTIQVGPTEAKVTISNPFIP